MAESFGAGGVEGVENCAAFGLSGIVQKAMTIRADAQDVGINVEAVIEGCLTTYRDDVMSFEVVLARRFCDERCVGRIDLTGKMRTLQGLLDDNSVSVPSRGFNLPTLWQSLWFDGNGMLHIRFL